MTARPQFVNVYQQAKAAGIEMDSHESDLYLLASPESLALLKASGYDFTTFKGTDGRMWYEVPFAYYPFWEAKAASGMRRHIMREHMEGGAA